MKKMPMALGLSLIFFSSVFAKIYVNQNHLAPQSQNRNLAMEYAGWLDQIKRRDYRKCNGTIQVVPFFERSTNKSDLGKYFGITNRLENYAIRDFIYVKDILEDTTSHLITPDFMHYYASYQSNIDAKIRFQPYQMAYGARFNYHQKLDSLSEGLFFKIDMPIVKVRTSLGYTATPNFGQQRPINSDLTTVTNTDLDQVDPRNFTGTTKTLEDYLTGYLVNEATYVKQVALNRHKIHNGRGRVGIADIDCTLGYNIVYREDRHFGITAAVTIPVSPKPKGHYRFEPIIGNSGHWAVGTGLDGAYEFWNYENKSMDISMMLNYKYLLKGTETRTLNYRHPDLSAFGASANKRARWGQYVLAGKQGDTFCTPFANFLTQPVSVTPGSQINAMADITVSLWNFTFDFGYEFFAQERESLTVTSWTDDTYGKAAHFWNTENAFIDAESVSTDLSTIYAGNALTSVAATTFTIDKEHLITEDSESPTKITHKIFTGIAYATNHWKYPLLFSLGGSHEFHMENSALQNWAIWGKFGMTF
jgi:hypothetical protein